jgi:hypothetical protein
MAICPFAEQKLLPESATQAAIRPRAVIAHSAGGEAELYGWWQNDESRGLESHFWIGWDGRTVQYVDTEVRADANGQANSFAVSIETASTVHATERWDPPQARALVRLIDWLCDVHDIPREQMVKPTSSGLGWHVMFGAPGPWTTQRGKVCPGDARIRELKADIFPAIFGGTAPMEDDMTPEQAQKLNEIHGVLFAGTPATPRNLSVYARLVDVQTALTAALPTLVADARKGDVDPSAIAAAVVTAIPADLAQDVIDGLGRKLTASGPA